MNAQMPPSIATLTDSASNSVMVSPIDVVGQHIHLLVLFLVLRSASLSKHYHGFRIDPFVKSSQCQRCGFVAAQQLQQVHSSWRTALPLARRWWSKSEHREDYVRSLLARAVF